MKPFELKTIRDCVYQTVKSSLRDVPLNRQGAIYESVLRAVEDGLLNAVAEKSQFLARLSLALGLNRATLRRKLERAGIDIKAQKAWTRKPK